MAINAITGAVMPPLIAACSDEKLNENNPKNSELNLRLNNLENLNRNESTHVTETINVNYKLPYSLRFGSEYFSTFFYRSRHVFRQIIQPKIQRLVKAASKLPIDKEEFRVFDVSIIGAKISVNTIYRVNSHLDYNYKGSGYVHFDISDMFPGFSI